MIKLHNIQQLIEVHATALQTASHEKTKTWWENYMQGVMPFRGAGIPQNRSLLADWRNEYRIEKLPLTQQLDLALAFLTRST
ncbi:MAG: hypothetical protein P1S60_02780 [Anaerolineae bacterium]|nr:hypothetical protein [Anaerolineae bacterium]